MADMAGTLKMRKILRERREEEAIAKKPKLRVAAYCRVSTPSEEQATSVREQKIVYETRSGITRNGNLLVYSPTKGSPAQRYLIGDSSRIS